MDRSFCQCRLRNTHVSVQLYLQDLHGLLCCREPRDRLWRAEGRLRPVLFREETRWPGYYYRADFPALEK